MDNSVKINPKKLTWDLSPLYASDNDPQIESSLKEVEAANNRFIKKWQNRDDYLTDETVLKPALDEYEKLERNYGTDGKAGYYFSLRLSQNQTDPQIRGRVNQIMEFGNRIRNEIRFFELRLAKINPQTQRLFLRSQLLKPYQHFLERLFEESKHLLSDQEEKILTLKYPTSYFNWVHMLDGFLAKEEAEVLLEDGKTANKNFSEILSLINSPKKRVRDKAGQAFNQILAKYLDVAESEINSVLANKKVDDELRLFTRPDASRILADDYDTETVDTLVKAVSSHFQIAQKYYELKAKLLKLPKLAYHERNVPFGKVNKKYSFEDSTKLVYEVLNSLDPEFGEIFLRFVENSQYDVYPAKGKRGGAFCAYGLISQPTYLLLNHTDLLQDVLTLAHETGHGINDELMKTQNSLNFGTPLSVAEVASTFMEDFVLERILKEADDELKLTIMMTKLNDDVSTIFRQIACFMFEQELHQKFRETGFLSKDQIGQLFQKYMSSYMGKSVEQSKGSENWWVYWSHIRNYFYNYSYANGLLISKALQSSVRKDPKFISKVKEFLATGSSEAPQKTFKRLGIDVKDETFWNQGLEEINQLLKETTKLAKKLNKI